MLDKVRLEIVFTNNLKEEKKPNIFLKKWNRYCQYYDFF